MGSHYESRLSIVFKPALGETVSIDTNSSSLLLSAASANSLDLSAQIGEALSKFERSDILSLSDGVKLYQVSLNTSSFSCEGPTDVSIFDDGSDERQLLGKISIVRSKSNPVTNQDFCTTIILDAGDEFKSQRLEWLDPNHWEGWAWYRPRDTWIEASFTSLRELSPSTPSHSLLLRPATRTINSDSVLAVFPASSAEAFVNLSAARHGESSGIYARVRRVKQGGKAKVFVTGKLTHKTGTVTTLRGAIELARKQYCLQPTPFQTDTYSGNPFNRLGFCTWSSIGENIRLTYGLLKDLVQSIRQDNVPIGTFIIDDGWQDIRTGRNGAENSRGLWSFGTWPGMGSTLSEAVQLIKDTLPTVCDVGVWMTLYGYWNSVAPDSPLVKKYDMRAFHLNPDNVPGIIRHPYGFDGQQTCSIPEPTDRVYYLPPRHRAYDFWKDYFSSCAAGGVSFVKIDNQAYGSYLGGVEGGQEFVAIWNGMTEAANTVFGENRVIHCMAHYERMFNGDIGLGAACKGRKIVIRNSDDFGLHRPNIHRDHIRYNIYNALLTSNLCFVPDADMFMTSAQWPEYHAILRAFFDGPVLLADKPGSYDPHILSKLIALSPTGEGYEVVKTESAIRPLSRNIWERFLEGGVGPALKGASYFPSCGASNIVLWNCRDGAHDDAIDIIYEEDLADALELSNGSGDIEVAVWATKTGKIKSLTVSDSSPETASQPILSISLAPKATEILTIAPYHTVGEVAIACLGLIDKYAGLAAIQKLEFLDTRLCIRVKYQGILGLLVSKGGNWEKSFRVTVEGKDATFNMKPQSGEAQLVQLDLSTAPSVLDRAYYTVIVGFW